jgi:hypothetical protein
VSFLVTRPVLPFSRFAPHVLACSVVLLFAACFGSRTLLLSPAGWTTALWWGGIVALIDPRPLLRSRPLRACRLRPPRALIRAGALFLVIASWLAVGGQPAPVLAAFVTVGLGGALRALLGEGRRIDRRSAPEWVRVGLLLGGALLFIHPYLTTRLVGAGDAEHYGRAMADFIAQVRGGVFPVWIGQTLPAVHGAVHPLRVAPYFQYSGGALDLVTGHGLSPIGLQNLLIVCTFIAAGLSVYAVFVKLAGSQRWSALWLAILSLSSPGVLALLYAGDMVASWMALPWLPWLFYGWVLAWRDSRSTSGPAWQAIALAVLWLAHAPIALWCSVLTLGSEVARWIANGCRLETLLRQIGTALACLLLCHYTFVSVASLDVPANPYLGFELMRGAVFDSVAQAWQGWWRSVSAGGADLARDLHLGPGLLLVGGVALLGAWRAERASRALMVGAALLFVSLLPWRGVTDRFWNSMPVFVMTVSEKWPAQRFYPILSILIPVAAALVLSLVKSPVAKRGAAAALALAALGSAWEARKFLAHGQSATRSAAATQRFLLPENNTLSRYSYEMWGYLPDHFTFGYMDAENQNRIIDPVSGNVVTSNHRALQRAATQRPLQRFASTGYGARLSAPILVPPREAVLVRFEFRQREIDGTLVFSGHRISRRYELPRSGGPRAFGPHPGQSKTVTLRNEADTPEQVQLDFFARTGTPVPDFAVVQSVPIQRGQLPIRLKGLIPFTLELDLPNAGWLETPKLFLRDYEATVDGRAIQPARSPNGLLMLPVPIGPSTVQLRYVPPPLLVASFWATCSAWFALGTLVLARALAPSRASLHLSPERLAILVRRLGLAGLVLGGTCTLWALGKIEFAPRDGSEQLAATGPVTLRATFPVGRHEVYETLLSWCGMDGSTLSIVVFYQDDRHIRLGCRKNGVLKVLSDALPVSYFVEHTITAAFLPSAPTRLQLAFNHHPIWETECAPYAASGGKLAAGRDPDSRAADGNAFRGRLLVETSEP